MTGATTLPDPSQVEGFPHGIKAKIILTKAGIIRVVVRDYYHDKKKKRGLEKRKYLGYIVGNRYYPTEEYRQQFKRSGERRLVPHNNQAGQPRRTGPALEFLHAGEFPLYYSIARDIGLIEDLERTWAGRQPRQYCPLHSIGSTRNPMPHTSTKAGPKEGSCPAGS